MWCLRLNVTTVNSRFSGLGGACVDPLLCARFQTGYRVLLNPNDSSGQIQMNEVTQMPVTGTGIKGKGAAVLFKTCCASTIKRRFHMNCQRNALCKLSMYWNSRHDGTQTGDHEMPSDSDP